MKQVLQLTAFSWRQSRAWMLGLAGLLFGFQILLVVVGVSFEQAGTFQQLGTLIPPVFRNLLGPSFPSLLSFTGMVSLGYFHLVVFAVLTGVAIAIGTEVAGEMETHFVDMILAKPVKRVALVWRTILFLVLSAAGLLAVMVASTWLALTLFAPFRHLWPTPRLIFSMAGNLALLVTAWGSVSLAVATAGRRRGAVAGLMALVAFGTFIINFLGSSWAPMRPLTWISPFRYYDPLALLMGRPLSLQHILVLSGITLAGWLVAYRNFSRRDL